MALAARLAVMVAVIAIAACRSTTGRRATGGGERWTAAVVALDGRPVPPKVVESVVDSLESSGYTISEDLETYDLLVVCAARPASRMSPVPDEAPAITRGTSIVPPLHRPDGPGTRWLAAVTITYDEWYGNPSEWYTLRAVDVSVGTQGLDTARFTRGDLHNLWSALESWIAGESGARHKRPR